MKSLCVVICSVILVLLLIQAAVAQTEPPPEPVVLPDPIWPSTLAEFNAKMIDPAINSGEKIALWQNWDGTADYTAAMAITFLAQQNREELSSMTAAIESLAVVVANQSAAQMRLAIALEDMVTFKRLELSPMRTPAITPININTADPESLMDVNGIGPSLAMTIATVARISPFPTVDSLLLVPGMTKSLLDQISPFLTVE